MLEFTLAMLGLLVYGFEETPLGTCTSNDNFPKVGLSSTLSSTTRFLTAPIVETAPAICLPYHHRVAAMINATPTEMDGRLTKSETLDKIAHLIIASTIRDSRAPSSTIGEFEVFGASSAMTLVHTFGSPVGVEPSGFGMTRVIQGAPNTFGTGFGVAHLFQISSGVSRSADFLVPASILLTMLGASSRQTILLSFLWELPMADSVVHARSAAIGTRLVRGREWVRMGVPPVCGFYWVLG